MKKVSKKNILIIWGVIVILIVLLALIIIFIKKLNEDKKEMENNEVLINSYYDNLKKEAEEYNQIRKEISLFINDFYYETVKEDYENQIESFKKYDDEILEITDIIKELDKKCKINYTKEIIQNKCNSYKKDYETMVNVFLNDINNYNKKLDGYNKERGENLDLFKSSTVLNYIDYDEDGIYLEKDDSNE